MGNQLDELTGPVSEQGRDVNVIHKQIKVEVGVGSLIFEILLWILIIPGLIFLYKKVKARDYFNKLEQKIQHNASQIDNYLEQRVVILDNVVGLVNRSTKLDKEVMTSVAALRGGGKVQNDEQRNDVAEQVDTTFNRINVAFEAYPELKSQNVIADAMQQNSYLQREITAAREVYNDTVRQWNQDIFAWPTKRIVAARNNYTTRIPFTATAEVKERARQTFF